MTETTGTYTLEDAEQDIANLQGQVAVAASTEAPTIVAPVLFGYATTNPRGPYTEDFEGTGSGSTGGFTATNGALSASTAYFFSGAYSLLLTANGGGNPSAVSPLQRCGPSDPISVQAAFSCGGALTNVYIGIQYFDGNQTFISETDAADIATLGPGFTYILTVSDNSPTDCYYYAVVYGDHAVAANGSLLYLDLVQGSGNQVFSLSVNAGEDALGNQFDQGLEINAVNNLTQAISVQDAWGLATLMSIDAAGNGTFNGTLSANYDMVLSGQSLTDQIYNEMPQGVVAYSQIATSLPSGASAGQFIEELDVTLPAGTRTYEISVCGMYGSSSAAGNNVTATLYFTTDGSLPTTSSTVMCVTYVPSAPTGSRAIPDMKRVYRNGGVLLRMRLYIQVSAGTFTCQASAAGGPNADNFAIVVEDIGPNVANTGIYQGGGGSSQGTQTYTKTYTATDTYAYSGSDGTFANSKLNHNGKTFQGGDVPNTFNGHTKSWIVFPGQVATDLSGATVNWVKLKLTNWHSWYDSGMSIAVGYDATTSFPSTKADPSGGTYDLVEYGCAEGQALTFKIDATGTSFGAAFKSGAATNIVLYRGTNNLEYYGYFAGASSSHAPQLIVNYTK